MVDNLERRDPAKGSVRVRGIDHKTREGIIPQRALQRKLFDAGFAGISWPTEYGGQGLTPAHERAFNEEALAYVLPDFGVAGGVTVCARIMLVYASPEFLRLHIPKILSGEAMWVQFFSEPGAGSDLAGITTRATRDGDRWILNGSKIWTSGASYADYGMCLARTDWEVPKHRGLTWFAVPTDAPGVTIQPIREINGSAMFCQEFLDDVELTDDDVIGDVNQGWSIAQRLLIFERGGGYETAPRAEAPHGLPDDLVTLARRFEREKEPHVRQLIARAYVNDTVLTQLGTRIGGLIRAGAGDPAGIASYVKLAAGTFGVVRARIGMEIGRSGALVWEQNDAAGMVTSVAYLNGRMSCIGGGTSEMQRNAIGERVLGLPREPSFDRNLPFSEVVRNAAKWTGDLSSRS
jgi:alkylation response protein AidB-like acyl-CoA dehydrogenase